MCTMDSTWAYMWAHSALIHTCTCYFFFWRYEMKLSLSARIKLLCLFNIVRSILFYYHLFHSACNKQVHGSSGGDAGSGGEGKDGVCVGGESQARLHQSGATCRNGARRGENKLLKSRDKSGLLRTSACVLLRTSPLSLLLLAFFSSLSISLSFFCLQSNHCSWTKAARYPTKS